MQHNEREKRKKKIIDYSELPERYIFYISCTDIWEGFKTADPSDNSEGGELSKQVRFLKTEEGGIKIMCEIMERIREEGKREGMKSGIREGIKSGMLESHKKTAWNLEKMGMPLDSIAKVVEEDISVVRQWLKPAK